MVVVGEARGVHESAEVADATRPHVVVTEIRLADGSGVQAIRRILSARPQTRVLVLTSVAREGQLLASIRAGANGYLAKDVSSRELIRSIRIIAFGGSLLDPEMTRRLLERIREGRPASDLEDLGSLTKQEERVLELLGSGMNNKAIGAQLHLAEGTVRNYISRIVSKLGVGNRAESVAYLARRLRPELTDAGPGPGAG